MQKNKKNTNNINFLKYRFMLKYFNLFYKFESLIYKLTLFFRILIYFINYIIDVK